MQTLKITSIKTKQQLHDFYDFQMPAIEVTREIQEIVRKNRGIEPDRQERTKVLKPKEVLIFMIDNGYPNGYVPDEEIKIKIKEINEMYKK